MKALLALVLFALPFAAFAEDRVPDKYCGAYYGVSMSEDGGATWENNPVERILTINADEALSGQGTVINYDGITRKVENGQEYIIIKVKNRNTFFVFTKAKNQYWLMQQIQNGSERARFLCEKR